MSNEAEARAHRRHRGLIVTASVVAAIALVFYVGAFFIGYYLHGGH